VSLSASRGPRSYLAIAAVLSALGGVLFGYDNIVISGAIHYLSLHFRLTAGGTGWAAGCALVGCIAGSASAGAIADYLGQKKALAVCAACFGLSSLGIWFSRDLGQFVAWRLLAGLGIGTASIVCPMYIAEIAPSRLRGRLVTLYQLGIVMGILAAVFSNMRIQRTGDEFWNETVGWRLMFLIGVAPAILFGVMILQSVESPRWLLKMGRKREALEVLEALNDHEAAITELSEVETALALETGRFSELFTIFKRPLMIGIMLAAFQQISGITPILSFLPDIFGAGGTATGDAFFQSVLVGITNLVFTLFALWLVDMAGRKTLILAGSAVQCLALALVGWTYHSSGGGMTVVFSIIAFVAGHAFGNGVACWVIISEIYPAKVRGRAMSIATTALWTVGYLGNQLFPLMVKHFRASGTFWTFSAGALLTFVSVYLFVPETRGQTLEQITLFWTSRGTSQGPTTQGRVKTPLSQ
jgi:SP family arabinose:H+ symporter-like MFS transporter